MSPIKILQMRKLSIVWQTRHIQFAAASQDNSPLLTTPNHSTAQQISTPPQPPVHNLNQMTHAFPLVALLMLSSEALAATELHEKHACTACHADNKKIGSSYQDVAARFAKDWKAKDGTIVKPADAPGYLTDKIRKSGANNWGVLPMPSNVSATDAELKVMAAAILTTKAETK